MKHLLEIEYSLKCVFFIMLKYHPPLYLPFSLGWQEVKQ